MESIAYKNAQEKYRKEHPEEVKKATLKWRNKNKERVAQKKKEWRKNNKDKVSTEKKRSYEKHKEEIKAKKKIKYHSNKQIFIDRMKEYRDKNKDKIYKTIRLWKLANSERVKKWNNENSKIYNQNRRARKKNAEGTFTKKEWDDLCEKYDNTCLRCGTKGKMTADHVIPLSKGGKNSIDNIQPLCGKCNSSKFTDDTDYRTTVNKDFHTYR